MIPNGLVWEDMTAEELLSRALSFDGGKPVTINNRIVEDDDFIARYHNYVIEKRGTDELPWAVMNAGSALSTGGKWDYEPMPSSRSDHYHKTHRFATLQEAFTALDEYKKKELKRAKKAGWPTCKEAKPVEHS